MCITHDNDNSHLSIGGWSSRLQTCLELNFALLDFIAHLAIISDMLAIFSKIVNDSLRIIFSTLNFYVNVLKPQHKFVISLALIFSF